MPSKLWVSLHCPYKHCLSVLECHYNSFGYFTNSAALFFYLNGRFCPYLISPSPLTPHLASFLRYLRGCASVRTAPSWTQWSRKNLACRGGEDAKGRRTLLLEGSAPGAAVHGPAPGGGCRGSGRRTLLLEGGAAGGRSRGGRPRACVARGGGCWGGSCRGFRAAALGGGGCRAPAAGHRLQGAA